MTGKNLVIRLHGNAPFDRGAKARWLLNEMGVKYEDRFGSSDYLKLNPMGRIPVAEIDGRVLFESGAICAYLADLFLEKGMAPALDAPERAEYQQWMYFASATIDSLQWRVELIEDFPRDALLEEWRDILKTLDQTLSKSSFLVGNRFSTADICVSYQLYWHRFWPEGKSAMREFSLVDDYVDRMLARSAAKSDDWPRPS